MTGEKVRTEMWEVQRSNVRVSSIIYRQVVAADELAGRSDRIVISNASVELWKTRRKF